jgi:hypothetical protein
MKILQITRYGGSEMLQSAKRTVLVYNLVYKLIEFPYYYYL